MKPKGKTNTKTGQDTAKERRHQKDVVAADEALARDLQKEENALERKLIANEQASERAAAALASEEENLNLPQASALGGRGEGAGSDGTTEEWTQVKGRKKGSIKPKGKTNNTKPNTKSKRSRRGR